jgi:hypothetical protein
MSSAAIVRSSHLWYHRRKFISNSIKIRSATDGLSALSHGCGRLRSINLGHCKLNTGDGLSTLAERCGQLQTINLSGCEGIIDIRLSALGRGWGQL